MPRTETKREATYDEKMNMQDRARAAAEERKMKREEERDKMKNAVKKAKESRIAPTLRNRKEMLDQAEKDSGL